MLFKYRALTPSGRTRQGTREADGARAVRDWLRQQGLVPIEVMPVQERLKYRWWRPAASIGDLALLVRQLQTLLETGTPLSDALRLLLRQYERGVMQRLIGWLYEQVQQGYGLAQAMTTAPLRLPSELIASVRAGEESGHLDAVLAQMADTLENTDALRKKLIAALIYPALVVMLALAIVFFLISHVVPKIVTVFNAMDQALPPLTQGLIVVSSVVQQHGGVLLFSGLLAIGGLIGLWRRPGSRRWMQRLLLHLPIVRQLLIEASTARWARTLGTLLDAGVPAVSALRIANETVSVLPLQARLMPMVECVSKGESITSVMEKAGFFPPLMLHLVSSGEHNGQLEAMLMKGAQRYEQNVARTAQTLLALLEPLMIIIMGGVVLTIVLAVMLPIFSMNQMVGQ